MTSKHDDPIDLYREAVIAYQRGEADRAEALSRQLLAEHPGDEQASLLLGGLLLHRQAHEKAAEVLATALTFHPGHPRLLVNQSVALRGIGRLDEAVDAARQAVDADTSLLSAWNALGIALIECKRYREAEASLREGLEQHPNEPALVHHLNQAIEAQGQHEQAAQTRASLREAGAAKRREAQELVSQGRFGPAEPLFREATQLNPADHVSHSALGRLLLQLGRNEEAITCLKRALELAPGHQVSRHFLDAALGKPPAHADDEYVRNVFDAYAERFDQHLVEGLAYRVPEALAKLLEKHCPDGLGEVLDLGCGTGLAGEHLAARASAMDGVDLSSEMLIRARDKNLYRDLFLADIGDFVSQASRRWQTVVAADVFIYFGDVSDLFRQLKDCMQPGGWLVFSVESTDAGGLELHAASGRYRHGRKHLVEALEGGGFGNIEFSDTVIRREHGHDIEGWLVAARAGG